VIENRAYICKVLRERKYEFRILYPPKLLFKFKGHKDMFRHLRKNMVLMNSFLNE
jgi:hypothetical protein